MFDYCAPTDLLKDRVIMITGAGSGIGRACAKAYAQYGATVILCGRTTAKLEQVYQDITKKNQPTPWVCLLDLNTARPKDMQKIAELVTKKYGRLDGLVHNAGILGKLGVLVDQNEQLWHQVMQVNVNAVFMLTKALLPLLRLTHQSAVLFTSSGVGRKGRAGWGAYAVSKAATESLMQVMAAEEARISSVRVNAINPGATRSAMRALACPEEDPSCVPAPEAIMPLYLYLMGAQSQGVHGQSLDAQA